MENFLPHTWQALPPEIVSRFGAKAGRQRAMQHAGHLLLVTHAVPAHDAREREAVLFWRAPDGAWQASRPGQSGLSELKALLGDYLKKTADLENKLEAADRALHYFQILQAVAPLLRAARHLHKTLQDAREAVPSDTDLIALRDVAAEIERTAELVQADAKAGLDFTAARRAEEQALSAEHVAQAGHRLNLLAALFLPISALGSVFGVNLAHGLETRGAPYVFWAFVIGAFGFGFLVRAAVDRAEQRTSV